MKQNKCSFSEISTKDLEIEPLVYSNDYNHNYIQTDQILPSKMEQIFLDFKVFEMTIINETTKLEKPSFDKIIET